LRFCWIAFVLKKRPLVLKCASAKTDIEKYTRY
jgi:hypothetical protein